MIFYGLRSIAIAHVQCTFPTVSAIAAWPYINAAVKVIQSIEQLNTGLANIIMNFICAICTACMSSHLCYSAGVVARASTQCGQTGDA